MSKMLATLIASMQELSVKHFINIKKIAKKWIDAAVRGNGENVTDLHGKKIEFHQMKNHIFNMLKNKNQKKR